MHEGNPEVLDVAYRVVVVWKKFLWSIVPTLYSWRSKFKDSTLFSVCLTDVNNKRSQWICKRGKCEVWDTYFYLKGHSPTNIKAELYSTLEESVASFTTQQQ